MSRVLGDEGTKEMEPKTGGKEEEENIEPATLQWPADRERETREGAESRTESDRELLAGEKSRKGTEEEEESGLGSREEQEGEHQENFLPEKAAQVFSPAVTWPRETEAFWDMESEKSPFLGPRGEQAYQDQDYDNQAYEQDYQQDSTCVRVCPSRAVLKVGVSLFLSALFFPFLVWGGFVFLPFDAPLLDGAPLRLVYTLRCSVFASAPIVLGWLVLGVSRLRAGAVRPLEARGQLEHGGQVEVKEDKTRMEVEVHQRFVSDSASLFLLFFLQLVVMAMYLSQEQLKLVPLLTIIFALGRLCYWLCASLGSSVRGFGFGLSFLPSVAMLAANIYFIFTVEAAGSIFISTETPPDPPPPPAGRQRFWG